jgi:hypothetical protein
MRELYSALRDANIPEDKALATVLAFEERFNAIDRRFTGLDTSLEKLNHKVTIIIASIGTWPVSTLARSGSGGCSAF